MARWTHGLRSAAAAQQRKEQLAESKRVREESAQFRQFLREFKKGLGGSDFLRS
jgi:hypothetical protein